jgi:hypothetical protein
MASRGQHSALLAVGLATIFFQQLKVRKTEHTKWINVKSSSKAWEEHYDMAGLGQMVEKAEGASYTFDEPIEGTTIRFTHITYGLAFRVTEEMLEDDQYGIMNRMASELAKSAAYNKDVQATSVLNNAFDSNYTGYDGLELCSEVHVLRGGGTAANEPATQVDLDAAPLQAGIEAFESWTDHRGYITDHTPKMLVHNTGDIWEAATLLETEYKPHSQDNDINVVRSRYGITPLYLKHLTDPDMWFLLGAKGEHGMLMYMRKNDMFRQSDDPYNGDLIHTARHRLSVGFDHWWNVYGSSGAA